MARLPAARSRQPGLGLGEASPVQDELGLEPIQLVFEAGDEPLRRMVVLYRDLLVEACAPQGERTAGLESVPDELEATERAQSMLAPDPVMLELPPLAWTGR